MHELAEQFPGRKVSFLVCSNEPRDAQEFGGLSVGICRRFSSGRHLRPGWLRLYHGRREQLYAVGLLLRREAALHLRDSKDRIEREKFRVCYFEEVPQ